MKNLFFGLAIAVLAFGASAFTNAEPLSKTKALTTVYITGQTATHWTYTGTVPDCDDTDEAPCQLNANPSSTFTFDNAPGQVLKTDVANPAKVQLISTRSAF